MIQKLSQLYIKESNMSRMVEVVVVGSGRAKPYPRALSVTGSSMSRINSISILYGVSMLSSTTLSIPLFSILQYVFYMGSQCYHLPL